MNIIHYIECECGSSDHVARLCWMPETFESDADVWLEIQLLPCGFFSRICKAFKYVLGITEPFGHWDVTLIGLEERKTIIKLLEDSIKHGEEQIKLMEKNHEK